MPKIYNRKEKMFYENNLILFVFQWNNDREEGPGDCNGRNNPTRGKQDSRNI